MLFDVSQYIGCIDSMQRIEGGRERPKGRKNRSRDLKHITLALYRCRPIWKVSATHFRPDRGGISEGDGEAFPVSRSVGLTENSLLSGS